MQNIDESLPVILHTAILKTAAIFLFFEVETWFLVWSPILDSCLSVQKELGKKLFFPRNHRGGGPKMIPPKSLTHMSPTKKDSG